MWLLIKTIVTKKTIALLIPLLFSSGIFLFGQVVNSTWEIFNEANSPLPNNTIRCLLVDHSDDLWIGTDNGLARLSAGVWTVFTTANSGLTDNYVRALAVDANNSIWIGTTLGGLLKFDGSTWQSFTTSNSGIPDNYIKTISIDLTGTKWLGTAEGLSSFDDTNWTTWTTANSALFTNNISSIGVGFSNEKYIGTINGGLTYMDNNSIITGIYYVLNSGVPDNSVLKVQIDNAGKPWYAGSAGGLFTDTGSQNWLAFNYSNSPMLTNSLTTMHLDGDNNFYLGTQMNGLMIRRFDQSWGFYATDNSELPENYILSLAKDAKQDVWIGSYSKGLIRMHEDFLGTNELIGLAHLQAYPNPVQRAGTIYFSRILQRPKIVLTNTAGKVIFTEYNLDQLESIELPNIESGCYFLEIQEGNACKIIRVVVS